MTDGDQHASYLASACGPHGGRPGPRRPGLPTALALAGAPGTRARQTPRRSSRLSARGATVRCTVPRTQVDCPIGLDDRPVRCETLLGDAGPYTLAVSTTLGDLAISLHSTYLGHPDADETQVAHLLLGPGRTETKAHAVDPAALPVAHRRRLCLYDHLAVLREFVADATGSHVSVDLGDGALELIDVA